MCAQISTTLKTVNAMKRVVIATAILASIAALTGCNVTRTITTTSSSIQRGDTTVIIQSKTIEQYDASKKF